MSGGLHRRGPREEDRTPKPWLKELPQATGWRDPSSASFATTSGDPMVIFRLRCCLQGVFSFHMTFIHYHKTVSSFGRQDFQVEFLSALYSDTLSAARQCGYGLWEGGRARMKRYFKQKSYFMSLPREYVKGCLPQRFYMCHCKQQHRPTVAKNSF